MPYAELRNSILKARQQRWDTLLTMAENLENGCIITIAGNAAGATKDSPVLRGLISHAEMRMVDDAKALALGAYGDAAGYIVFMRSPLTMVKAKEKAVSIEHEHEWNRLLDIDIYGRNGSSADRSTMGLAPRRCLLCGEPAADCIRTQRHDYCDIIGETERLLKGFQRTFAGAH